MGREEERKRGREEEEERERVSTWNTSVYLFVLRYVGRASVVSISRHTFGAWSAGVARTSASFTSATRLVGHQHFPIWMVLRSRRSWI